MCSFKSFSNFNKKLVDWVLQKLAQGGSKVSYFAYGNTAYEEWKLPLFATSNINYFCGQISSTCVEGVKGNTLTNRQHLKKADFQNFQIKETNYTIYVRNYNYTL